MTIDIQKLKQHLRRQLLFLAHSCSSYDHGFHDEALRMAVVLRVLFHDTKQSTSLLKHLNALATPIVSTCEMVRGNVVFFEGMGRFQIGPRGFSLHAPLGDGRKHVPMRAPEWWWQIVSVQGPG